ncbi:hypothetical protein PFISCL1PPCAC_886, partial [Pristionchus fissidentatus]
KSPPGACPPKKRTGKGLTELIMTMSSQRYSGNYFDYKFNDILRVLIEIKEVFRNEKALVECQTPVVIVGDLHGQYHDLLRMFNSFNDNSQPDNIRPGFLTSRYVFLGDYVDRGKQSIEVVMLLFLLKIKFNKAFLLLRGNHESKSINRVYGFKAELEERFDKGDASKLFHMFNEVFTYMPLACLVGGSILCMHGGISPKLKSLDDIREIPKPLVDPNENAIAIDLLWADPMIGLKGSKPNEVRGVSVHFGEDVLEEIMQRLGLTLVVRGHQMMMAGFRCYHGRKLVTIFTATSYYPDRQNTGAVMVVSRDGRVGFKFLTPVDDKKNGESVKLANCQERSVIDSKKIFRGAHDDANDYDTGYLVF